MADQESAIISSIKFTPVKTTRKGHVGFVSLRFGPFRLRDIAVYLLRHPQNGRICRLVYPRNERTKLNTFHPTDRPTSKLIEEAVNDFLKNYLEGGPDDDPDME